MNVLSVCDLVVSKLKICSVGVEFLSLGYQGCLQQTPHLSGNATHTFEPRNLGAVETSQSLHYVESWNV